MSANPSMVLELGVGGKLGASVLSRPLLRRLHEKPTAPAPTNRWLDVPTLEIPDPIAFAALGLRPHRELDEPDE